MPVYNTGLYISEAIQSLLNQTYKDFELLIINDGSSDNSRKLIKSFDDDRIKYFENEKNSGIVFSRNKGLKLAKGNYIGMLDSDDIAYPEKFEKQITFLEQNKDFGMVGSWAKFIDENGKQMQGSWKLKAKPEMIPSIMLFKNYFLQSAVLYRRECISKFAFKEGFDILEDYLIWLEIIKEFRVWNLQEYLVDYRIHEGGVTKKYSEEKLLKEKEVFRIQLMALEIELTEQEMKLHLLIRNEKQITEIRTLKLIETWLLKIISQNEDIKIYDQRSLNKVVLNRWLKVSYKASGLHMKMVYHFSTSEIISTFIKSNILGIRK